MRLDDGERTSLEKAQAALMGLDSAKDEMPEGVYLRLTNNLKRSYDEFQSAADALAADSVRVLVAVLGVSLALCLGIGIGLDAFVFDESLVNRLIGDFGSHFLARRDQIGGHRSTTRIKERGERGGEGRILLVIQAPGTSSAAPPPCPSPPAGTTGRTSFNGDVSTWRTANVGTRVHVSAKPPGAPLT